MTLRYPHRLAAVRAGGGHHPSCRKFPARDHSMRPAFSPGAVDASRIISGVYQGGIPSTGPWVRAAGFDVLVLAAKEYQPKAIRFPGVWVIHLPLDDVEKPLSRQQRRAIRAVAAMVAERVRLGERALITCAAGLNRSGIITASVVRRLTGVGHDDIVDHIRRKRSPRALSNRVFVAAFKNQHLGSSVPYA